ncbi:Skp1 family, dimerization domain protein [Cooperia oncophora]
MGSKKTSENAALEKVATPEKIYRVLTMEPDICEVPASIISMSSKLVTMFEDLNLQDEDEDAPIPILNVTAPVLKKVVAWCEKHKTEGNDIKKLEEWSEDFFNVDYPMLFEITVAATYLDIPKLLDDGCEKIAHIMEGKTPEEIRTMFNITNDFSPAEEEEIRRENAWYEV